MSRREPRYSVQDVIYVIQNGESDVDMDIDDTDEESDEEPCGVLYWTEKTNHPLTAQPMKTLSPSWPHLPSPMPSTMIDITGRKKILSCPIQTFLVHL